MKTKREIDLEKVIENLVKLIESEYSYLTAREQAIIDSAKTYIK